MSSGLSRRKKKRREHEEETQIILLKWITDMISTYDVLAIKVTRPFKYDKTVEMDEGVLLDFDEYNVPVVFRDS